MMDFDVITPKTKAELLSVISNYRGKKIRFGAGYTDLINHFKLRPEEGMTVINLAQLAEDSFRHISEKKEGFVLGTLVTATEMLQHEALCAAYPVLQQAANSVASAQIRNVATIGGNICNASPAADMAGALVALRATCQLLSAAGQTRQIPLSEFLTGPGKTALHSDEILESIYLPKNTSPVIKSGFEKIGTRRSMEISTVFLAYHFQLSENGIVEKAGVAPGSVAPGIPFAGAACEYITGKNLYNLDEKEKEKFAQKILEYATPITDIRATAWYRKEVLCNISKEILR